MPAPAPAEVKRKNVPIASIVPDNKAQPASKPPPPSAPHPSEVKIESSGTAPLEKGTGHVEQSKPGLPSSAAAPSKDKSPPRNDGKADRPSSRSTADVSAGEARPPSSNKDDERLLKEQKDQVMRSKQANSKSSESRPQANAADIGNKRGPDEMGKSSQQPSTQRCEASSKTPAAVPSSSAPNINQKPAPRDEPRRDSHRDGGARGASDSGARDGGGRDAVSSRDAGARDGRGAAGGGNPADSRDRTLVADSRRQPSAPPSNVNNPVPHDGRVDSGPGSKRARVDDRPASQAPPSRDQQSRHDSGRGHDAARGGDGRSRR